jgi:D-glycero-alpha-D-manno-heptose-7-phosphate kinase
MAPSRIVARAPVRIDLAGGWTDVPYFADAEGGAVLNAAIDRHVTGELVSDDGMRVSYATSIPSGAGLGTSAAFNVVWLALVNAAMGRQLRREEIAEQAFAIESLLGVLGGKQDQYAAVLGGIHLFRFTGAGSEAERLDLGPDAIAELRQRLVLCYSGEARLSGDIHEHVWSRYRAGDAQVTAALRRLTQIAFEMKDALVAGDLAALGDLLGENWSCQKQLHPSITNPSVDALFELATSSGAVSGKACGAGGGGCLLFFCPPQTTAALGAALSEAGAEVIDFAFDFEGLQVSAVKEESQA